MGTAAACSNETLAGFADSSASDAAAYSANAPWHQPNTSSPGRNRVTPTPTTATCPATSAPRTGFFGLRSPYQRRRTRDVRQAAHDRPVTGVDGDSPNANQHVVVPDRGLLDISEFQDLVLGFVESDYWTAMLLFHEEDGTGRRDHPTEFRQQLSRSGPRRAPSLMPLRLPAASRRVASLSR
jgi:hypothetical protein